MSLLWWQNGRDIDWFSTNLEKWIKPIAVAHPNSSQHHSGRYSKLKSCRLSKTCQTMMYIPQEQQSRESSYEETDRYQDNRTYKYSSRQEHYNSHYNYIRTTARRAYYKPETHQIVLAEEYDKIKNIQRQNRAKNIDYLLLLQQFLKHQQKKTSGNGTEDNIGTLTSYLNNNIQQYEETEQTITLEKFLQEGIQKYEHEHLVTLKEFLQENSSTSEHQQTAKDEEKVLNDLNKGVGKEIKEREEMTLQEFLKEDNENLRRTFSPTNPFANDMIVQQNRNNLFITQVNEKTNDNTDASIEEVSFEQFLKERQNVNCRNDAIPSVGNAREILNLAKTPVNNNDKLSLDEFLHERGRQSVQPSPILKKSKDISPRPVHSKVTFAMGGEVRKHSVDSADKMYDDEIVKESSNASLSNINQMKNAASRHPRYNLESRAESRSQSVDRNDKVSFNEFLNEQTSIRPASKEEQAITLDEFLRTEPLRRLGKSNEHKTKVKNRNSLKLSKSFNDKTNMMKETLLKKLTRNELPNVNTKGKDIREENNKETKITLYEFLKEDDQKTADIEESLRNMKIRTRHDDNDTFYEINNNSPEIKLNDNIIQIETRTPELKFNQYENNRHACPCDNQIVLTDKLYNENYSQLLSNNTVARDRSYDYHRGVRQGALMSPFQHRADNRLFTSMHAQGRRAKQRAKCVSPVEGYRDQGVYGPLWPSVLLTYDKVVYPHRMACPNESYA